jgi:hypothetical protein
MSCTAAYDFFVVHTITFRLLDGFVILGHGRRRILHFNVTAHPTAGWTAQQIVEAFPADGTEPKYLLRDRDSIYGDYFQHRVQNTDSDLGETRSGTTRPNVNPCPWQGGIRRNRGEDRGLSRAEASPTS